MPPVVQTITPPAVEPVDLATAKQHLRVTYSDDDALITALITAARRACETHVKRPFVTTTFEDQWDGFPFAGGYLNRDVRQQSAVFGGLGTPPSVSFLPVPYGVIEVTKAPLLSVTSINYLDATGNLTTLDPSLYRVQLGVPGRIQPAFGVIWPTTRPVIGAVQIRYTAGYGPNATDVPANVAAAMLLLIGNWYENRESVTPGVAVELPDGITRLLSSEECGAYG